VTDDDTPVSEEQVVAKWFEIAPGIDRMAERIGDPDDFAINDGSSISDDDWPFSGADAAIMADAFRKALRRPIEGDSPESQEQK